MSDQFADGQAVKMANQDLRTDWMGGGLEVPTVLVVEDPPRWREMMMARMVGINPQDMWDGRMTQDDRSRLKKLQARMNDAPLLITDRWSETVEKEIRYCREWLEAKGHSAVRIIVEKHRGE